jgi:hypothetical protein
VIALAKDILAGEGGRGARGVGKLAAWLDALRAAVALERLPLAPAAAPRKRGPSLLALLLVPEELPSDPESPRREVQGALRLLLAPEPLPLDPPGPPRRRGRWLGWLFAPERLDG